MEERIDVSKQQMVAAFNEWMRRYIEEPERYEAELRTVKSFQAAESKGEEPDYGSNCTEYLQQIIGEQTKK